MAQLNKKKWPRHLSRPRNDQLTIHVLKKPNPSRETVPLNNRAAPPAYICDEDLSVLVEAAIELRLEDRAEEGQDQLVRVDPFSARKLKNK